MFHSIDVKSIITFCTVYLIISFVIILILFVKSSKNKKPSKASIASFILYGIFLFLFSMFPRRLSYTVGDGHFMIYWGIISIILLILSIIIVKRHNRLILTEDLYRIFIIVNMLVGFFYYFFILACIVNYKLVPCTPTDPLKCMNSLLEPNPYNHKYGDGDLEQSSDQKKFIRQCMFNLPYRPEVELLVPITTTIESFQFPTSLSIEEGNAMKQAAVKAIKAKYEKIKNGDVDDPFSFEKEVCKQYYLLSKASK